MKLLVLFSGFDVNTSTHDCLTFMIMMTHRVRGYRKIWFDIITHILSEKVLRSSINDVTIPWFYNNRTLATVHEMEGSEIWNYWNDIKIRSHATQIFFWQRMFEKLVFAFSWTLIFNCRDAIVIEDCNFRGEREKNRWNSFSVCKINEVTYLISRFFLVFRQITRRCCNIRKFLELYRCLEIEFF